MPDTRGFFFAPFSPLNGAVPAPFTSDPSQIKNIKIKIKKSSVNKSFLERMEQIEANQKRDEITTNKHQEELDQIRKNIRN